MKFYEFRYKSKLFKLIGLFANVVSCFLYPILIALLLMFIFRIFNLTNDLYSGINSALILFSIILGFIFVIRYFSNSKGVAIFYDHLEIDRYSINDFHPIPNIKIYFKDIKSVYNSRDRIPLYSWKSRKALVTGGDKDYYVEILLNGGKEFYFPVENQEEFVKELLKRVNDYRLDNGLDKI